MLLSVAKVSAYRNCYQQKALGLQIDMAHTRKQITTTNTISQNISQPREAQIHYNILLIVNIHNKWHLQEIKL